MALIYQFKEKWIHNYLYDESDFSNTQLILDSFDAVYPPDGVDPLNETLNGSKEEYKSDDGKKFRTHLLTRLTSFIGLPNRKLSKNSGQSIQNLDDNFVGKQPDASATRNLFRAAVTPFNVIMMPLKLMLNLLKLVTEFIPGCLLKVGFVKATNLIESSLQERQALSKILKQLLGICLMYLLIPIAAFYFGGCCLTSSYGNMRSAWRIGSDFSEKLNHKYKQLAYLLVTFCILSTLINFMWATPVILKTFAITMVPIITHYLPSALIILMSKIGTAITPTLTAIGNAISKTFVVLPIVENSFLVVPFAHLILSIPTFVGASLFIATAITTLGPSISGYINDFKAWWNFNPDFVKPLENEGNKSEELSQQCKMLCALRETEESIPVVVVSELPLILENHISESIPLVNNIVGSSTNLIPPQDKQTELHKHNDIKLSAPSESKPDTDKIINHSTSPRRRS